MLRSSSKTVLHFIVLCLLGLPLPLVPQKVWAGEKIQITPRNSKANSAAETIKNGLYSDPLDFMKSRGGSGGGSLVPTLPPPANSTRSRPKQEDDMNWMFDTKGNIDQEAALQKIFGVRDSSFGVPKTGSKNANNSSFGDDTERWEQSSSGKNWLEIGYRKAEKASENGLKREETAEPNSGFEDKADSSFSRKRNELNLNNLLSPKQSKEVSSDGPSGYAQDPFALSGLLQSVNNTEKGRFGRTKEQEDRLSDFQNLLGVQPTLFVDQLRNTLDSQPDATRRDMNPIFGSPLESSGPSGLNPSSLNPFNSGVRAAPANSGLFDSFNTRSLGKSGLNPAMIIPPSVPVFQPKPIVLEIPRRKL